MTEETGWVIEHEDSEGSRPLYFCITGFGLEWSYDNLLAFRMARREDAILFRDLFLEGKGRVADHMWC